MDDLSRDIKILYTILFLYLGIRLICRVLDLFKNINQNKSLETVSTSSKQATITIFLKTFIWVIFSRIIIYFFAYVFSEFVQNHNIGFFESFEFLWNRWDTPHYLDIAKHWYQTIGEERYFIVFYPLYPILIKLFSFFIPNYFMSAVLISNISLVYACFYLYKLVRLDFSEKESVNAVKYLLIFPVSFFLCIGYSESLFILLTILAFYYMRLKKWFLVGMVGALASATRSFGVLIIIPAILEYIISGEFIYLLKKKNYVQAIFSLKQGIPILLSPLGFIYYLYLNKSLTGEWFRFSFYQKEHWNQSFGWFPDVLKNMFNTLYRSSFDHNICLWIPNLFFITLTIFLIYYSLNKLRISYLMYMFIYLILVSSCTWLLSGTRYILGLFPIYIVMALIVRNKILDFLFTIVSILLLGFFISAFVNGHSVM